MLGGRRCYRVVGADEASGAPVTAWIDAGSILLRAFSSGGPDPFAVRYEPEVDVWFNPAWFAFNADDRRFASPLEEWEAARARR